MANYCEMCNQTFVYIHDYQRHNRTVHGDFRYECPTCGLLFGRRDSYNRHIKAQHQQRTEVDYSRMVLVDPATVDQTMFSGVNTSGAPSSPPKDTCCSQEGPGDYIMSDENFTMFKKECALKGYTGTYCLTPDDVTSPLCYDPMEFLLHTGPMLERQLTKDLGEKKGLVFWMSLEVDMEKLDGTETTAHFTHKKKYIYNSEAIMEIMVTGFGDIIKHLEDFQERGSGWMVKSVNHLDVHCSLYRPLGAACYKPLPQVLRNKALGSEHQEQG